MILLIIRMDVLLHCMSWRYNKKSFYSMKPCRSKLYIACPDFFQKSARAHAAAPPFQIEPTLLGFDLVSRCKAENGGIYSVPLLQKIRHPFRGCPIFWCKRWDSNPHGGCHTHLKRACLPFQHSCSCRTHYTPALSICQPIFPQISKIESALDFIWYLWYSLFVRFQ